jgi:hypothetical protein
MAKGGALAVRVGGYSKTYDSLLHLSLFTRKESLAILNLLDCPNYLVRLALLELLRVFSNLLCGMTTKPLKWIMEV